MTTDGCSAFRKRIADLEAGLQQIASWKQEDQDDRETCILQWRGCVAIARQLLKSNVPVSGGAKRRSAPVACSARYPVFTIPQIRHYLTGGIFTRGDDPDGHLPENTALRALIAELEDREDGIEAVTARTEWRTLPMTGGKE